MHPDPRPVETQVSVDEQTGAAEHRRIARSQIGARKVQGTGLSKVQDA